MTHVCKRAQSTESSRAAQIKPICNYTVVIAVIQPVGNYTEVIICSLSIRPC